MYGVVTTSTTGATLVDANTDDGGMIIRVLRYHMMAAGATNVQFLSDTTPISGIKYLTGAGTGAAEENVHGVFETAVGEPLNISLSDAEDVSIDFTYIFRRPSPTLG